jgi:hypothetical protein
MATGEAKWLGLWLLTENVSHLACPRIQLTDDLATQSDTRAARDHAS